MESLLPQHPHCALICGKTRSGKTHQMLKILESYYSGKFENIYIICPTFRHNETYQKFPLNRYGKIIVCQGELVKTLTIIIKKQELTGCPKSLIIIDDCSAEQDLNKHRTALSKIAFSGRHLKLTTWFLTQRYISAPKDFRDNIDWVLVTKNSCRDSFEKLTRENDVIPAEKLSYIKEKIVNELMLFINDDEGKYLLVKK
jgi:hypothetical protein